MIPIVLYACLIHKWKFSVDDDNGDNELARSTNVYFVSWQHNNTSISVYGAVSVIVAIVRVYAVYLMNADFDLSQCGMLPIGH